MSTLRRPRILRSLEVGLRVVLVAGALAAVGAAAHVAGLGLGLGADRAPAARIVDCDCGGVGMAGVEGMRRTRDCRAHQARLYSALSHGDFALQAQDGAITGGSVCRSDAAGPDAWPVVGAPMSPWRTLAQ